MKGIQFIQLRFHIPFLSFTLVHYVFFLSSRGQLLNSCQRRLFCLHIQHVTRCLYERRTRVGSSETAVCRSCLSISLQIVCELSLLHMVRIFLGHSLTELSLKKNRSDRILFLAGIKEIHTFTSI